VAPNVSPSSLSDVTICEIVKDFISYVIFGFGMFLMQASLYRIRVAKPMD